MEAWAAKALAVAQAKQNRRFIRLMERWIEELEGADPKELLSVDAVLSKVHSIYYSRETSDG